MKKFFQMVAFASLTLAMTACYNDDDLWNKVDELETKVEANASDIAALSALVDALNNGKIIVGTQQTENGYVLTFNDGSQVSVLNGKDGADGKDGESGANGDSFFTSIEETDDIVIITLADGRVIKLPKALDYELRVLTFEDEDTKFTPYSLDYAGVDINTWSDLIDNPPYGGPLTYGDYMTAMYNWYDEGNTELTHTFPDNYAYCFWGGGHAISNYWGEGWSDEDRDLHIAKYYGEDYVTENAGNDAMLGWFNLQLMVPVKAHSGNNFAVHYGYKDFFTYIENLPEISFADGEPRVIDHMYVTNTNYTLNQLYNGVKSEAGNSFGGNWEGLTEDAWLKIVAQGFDDVDADAYADPISEVEFYLVNGKNVVTDWQKWDLSGLGEVAKVRFNFLYSDDMGGKYGFTIPGYFAYDDVAVRFDKE